ncbi:methyltransferase [Infirmifilum uzonense]|uniref:Methyltransferase n=1 Tax=Infirmifilum uzonense TaxID=1550241 RepID=A0A0F7CLF9_9CREN|nr:tRNA (N6-threonylcarbamoyladenosine(37)-N6)-methyltransferase TrmO [Infirmifilum uzonense]AKG39341.1 methyltransferase [Infirmifilum uzonense]
MSAEIKLKPIGYVRHAHTQEEVKSTWTGVEGYIELLPEYAEGLAGLEGFSHIIVISYLHDVKDEQRKVLRVRPRRLIRFGIPLEELPEVGVFATDSPHRPNPLALSILKLKSVQGNRLIVENLDLFDGTPVLDIKPYDEGRRIADLKLPEWYIRLRQRLHEILGDKAPATI